VAESGLPSGVVTFLFTDIEGSTRLLHGLGDDYVMVLRDHNALLGEAVEANGGRVVDTQGDSFFCVFRRVRDAAVAAAAAQRAFAAHAWPQGASVRVRMGIHAAEPELEDGRYVGLGVHRAARVGSAAHGGQVLVSNAAAVMLGDSRLQLRDLGAHPLKDFDRPERLYQLTVDGVPAKFPPPRTRVPMRRPKRLLAVALLVIGVAAVAIPLALTGGSGAAKLGPTSLALVDPKTNTVVDAIELGFKSRLIAAGAGAVWVADPDTSTLVKIDPRTRKIVRRTAIDPNGVPTGIAAGLGALWVTVNHAHGTIELLKIDPSLGTSEDTLVLDRLRGPNGGELYGTEVGIAVGSGSVWTAEGAESRVSRIDPTTLTRRVVAQGMPTLQGIAVGGNAVWVAGPNQATRVDTGTGATTSTPPSGQTAEIASIAVSPTTVYFATSAEPVVWSIDPENVQANGTTPIGAGPAGVAIGEGGIWVTSSVNGTVSRLAPNSGALVARIKTGTSAGGVVAQYGIVWVSPGTPAGANGGD